MNQRARFSTSVPEDFLIRLPQYLLPLEGWGYFRPGAKPAAVTFVLYRRGGEWHVPFVLRRADLPDHPGQVGLPGGGVRPGESALQAALRETQEEIGLPAAELVPLGAGRALYGAVSNFSVVAFVAWLARANPHLEVDPGELDSVLEVPLSVLLDANAWLDGDEPWPGRHLPVGGTRIWGLTARLLADLLPRIRAARSPGP